MPHVVVSRVADGEDVSSGTDVPVGLPATLAFPVDADTSDTRNRRWNPLTLALETRPVPTTTIITTDEVLDRIGDTALGLIPGAAAALAPKVSP